ncbi:MAG: Gfo/Idh/MocA family oxidoreductase [Hydrogenophilales bacterium]
MQKSSDNPQLLIIGCGEISMNMHIPYAIKHFKNKANIFFIDVDEDRLNHLKEEFNIPSSNLFSSIENVNLDQIDLAILATPFELNYKFINLLLDNNISMLVEKPITTNLSDYLKIKEKIVQKKNLFISVNQTKRFLNNMKMIKNFLTEKETSKIESIEYHDGGKFDWNSNSGFYFDGKHGVVMDRSHHALDLISWLINDQLKLIKFNSNKSSGPESHCHFNLEAKNLNIKISITLSWIYKLSNQIKINFSDKTIIAGTNELNFFYIQKRRKKKKFISDEKLNSYFDAGDSVIKGLHDRFFINENSQVVDFFELENIVKIVDETK